MKNANFKNIQSTGEIVFVALKKIGPLERQIIKCTHISQYYYK